MVPTTSFRNEDYVDFSKEENKELLRKTVEKVQKELGRTYPFIIGGKEFFEGELVESVNPANTKELIGRVHFATKEHADQALDAAYKAFETWSKTPAEKRAQTLFKAAEISQKRKLELSVWLVKECGKSIREAVADVAEGIDFMNYYAKRMIEIDNEKPVFSVPGENNSLHHVPLGVGLTIAPWNFPFAILCGMTVGAVVAGNCNIVKPASTTPVIAYIVHKIYEEAGFPKGVMNYLPGKGSVVGDYLVEHPKIRYISFTGSSHVGKRIYEKMASFPAGQKWFKRCIVETGGKNHAIVCEDADINKAAEGCLRGAFGYSGQKCSATAVALVHEKIYDKFLSILKSKTEKLKIGEGTDPNNFTGPVIDPNAVQKIVEYLEQGKKDGQLVIGGQKMTKTYSDGYFIQPTIFSNVGENSKLLKEEIFGPVLVVNRFFDFNDALKKVNSTGYGLTGGVFTSSEKNKELARRKFHVGNLYFNRTSGATTGAIVGRQPFGGFNMSGTDSKAGGRNYLYLFLQEKSVCDMI
ncbi:MAG TPA: L-glutamate gamma-semialdehyde dehydrogenase [Candidatus Bilamarchaeaceae archaeon]|nr:L-glutamate gamma-semialdehyde dehydrogenase [Candidatus Bilamarchaeaceae archaeon]